MNGTILVFTSSDDASVNNVLRRLEQMGEKVYRCNTDKFPEENILGAYFAQGIVEGRIQSMQEVSISAPLTKIKSCWYRGGSTFADVGSAENGYLRFIQEESRMALWALYTCIDSFWVNPPLIGRSLLGHNKPYQLKAAHQAGLTTPRTLITNDPHELLNFCKECGGTLAIKLLSGRVFVKQGDTDLLGIYTQRISEKDIQERWDSISLAPLLAQQYVPKKLELRITIVGELVFACTINSQSSERTRDDWRHYDFEHVKHEPYILPVEIHGKLLQLMKVWGLQFGAIDMIITPDDDYVFLEVNPQGQWGWIEDLTQMPISQAIANLLARS